MFTSDQEKDPEAAQIAVASEQEWTEKMEATAAKEMHSKNSEYLQNK